MIKPMQKPASTMNQDDNDNPQAGRRPLKFSYSSGSQPLSGYTIKRGIGVGGFGDVAGGWRRKKSDEENYVDF